MGWHAQSPSDGRGNLTTHPHRFPLNLVMDLVMGGTLRARAMGVAI